MSPLTDAERRALAIVAALLVLAMAARWIERPRDILGDLPELDVAALADASRDAKESRAQDAKPGRGGATSQPKLDPNTATAAQLERLPFIGASVAQRIVAEREKAPFATTGDLERVRGIGPALAAKLADYVTLPAGPAPARRTDAPRPAAAAEAPAQTAVAAEPIDLNRATAAQLDAVRGIGPALAARLVARRDSLGRFTTWEQVDATRGIGPAILAELRSRTVLR